MRKWEWCGDCCVEYGATYHGGGGKCVPFFCQLAGLRLTSAARHFKKRDTIGEPPWIHTLVSVASRRSPYVVTYGSLICPAQGSIFVADQSIFVKTSSILVITLSNFVITSSGRSQVVKLVCAPVFPGSQVIKMDRFLVFPGSQVVKLVRFPIFPGS